LGKITGVEEETGDRADDRGQRSEDGGQRADDRGQMTEGGGRCGDCLVVGKRS